MATPSNLTATGLTGLKIQLVWSDNSSAETGFEIQLKWGSSSFTTLATLAGNVTTYLHSNTPSGRVYTYQVRALGSSVNSGWSAPASAAAP